MNNLNNDRPIEYSNEDRLNRIDYANSIAKILLSYKDKELEEGLVFGLYGNWGSGKTSFINLIKECLKKEQSIKASGNGLCKKLEQFSSWVFSIICVLLVWHFDLSYFLFKFEAVRNFLYSFNIFIDGIYILSCFIVKAILICYMISKFPFNISWIFDLVKIVKNRIFYRFFYKKDVSEEIVVMDFAPWNILNENSIVKDFFNVLRKQLSKLSNPEILSSLDVYATKLCSKLSCNILDFDINNNNDVLTLKANLETSLKKSNRKFIVFIDDIDRLSDSEIYLMFKMIKSIANLPNIIYFLAFDKNIVANALNKYHKDCGLIFLDKIIQMPFEIPQIDSSLFQKLVFGELQTFLNNNEISDDIWDTNYKQYWNYTFASSIYKFFDNVRDLKRFINSIVLAYPSSLHNEINIVDLWMLNAIKLKLPELYDFIKVNEDLLTHELSSSLDTFISNDEKKTHKETIDGILQKLSASFKDDVYSILITMFPVLCVIINDKYSFDSSTLEQKRRTCRICCKEHFDKYFAYNITNEFTNAYMLESMELAKDYESFCKRLLEIDSKSKLKLFLDKFENFIDSNIEQEKTINIIKALFECGDYFKRYDEQFLEASIYVYMYRIILKFLEYNQDNSNEILKKAFSTNKSIAFVIKFVRVLNDMIARKQSLNFKQELIDDFKQNILKTVKIWVENDLNEINDNTRPYDGRLIRHPYMGLILSFWRDFGNQEEISEYVEQVTVTDKNLLEFIDKLKHVIKPELGDEYYKITKKDLEQFFNIEELKQRLEKINKQDLDSKDLSTLELALSGIENKSEDPFID